MKLIALSLTTAALAAVFISACAEKPPRAFEPGVGGGPGPQGCVAQKERAKANGEEPVC